MQDTFPRAVVDELRRKTGRYRHRSKVLLAALIKSEFSRLGRSVASIPDDVLSMVEVTDSGEIVGMTNALSVLQTK